MEDTKLYDIILYICNEVPPFKNGALKINKLIWFIESEYYRKSQKTITGVNFAAIDHGPIINDYKDLFRNMEKEKLLKIDKEPFGWKFTPQKASNLSSLKDDEKLVVKEIVEKLGALSNDALEELSHRDAYMITVHENSNIMGKTIDMDLVLLESSPIESHVEESAPDEEKLRDIIEKHQIETV